jgi:hypothetical protein
MLGMKNKILLSVSILSVIVTISCIRTLDDFFRDPDISPVRKVLTTTMPLGYVSNLAMSAINGTIASNVKFISGGDSSTGSFLMHITVDNNFPLPQGIEANGYIVVAGLHVNRDFAIMSALFSNMNITKGKFSITNIATFPVVQDTDLITGKKLLFAVYSDIDINVSSDTLIKIPLSQSQINSENKRYENMKTFNNSVIVEEKTYIIRIDDNNTTTIADDEYSVSGGGNYIESGSSTNNVEQIVIAGLKMSTECKTNPVSGFVVYHELEQGIHGNEIGYLILNAQTACNGTMKVTAATGNYIKSNGKSIFLNLPY